MIKEFQLVRDKLEFCLQDGIPEGDVSVGLDLGKVVLIGICTVSGKIKEKTLI